VITADTHVPHRARALPPELWRAVEEADAVIHETEAAKGREERCAAWCTDDVLVFGHSHIPWDTTAATGLRLLNPGSPTDRRRQPHCSYLTAVASGGRLKSVELHRLPPRHTVNR
jgi:predicted phosphodiesterase